VTKVRNLAKKKKKKKKKKDYGRVNKLYSVQFLKCLIDYNEYSRTYSTHERLKNNKEKKKSFRIKERDYVGNL